MCTGSIKVYGNDDQWEVSCQLDLKSVLRNGFELSQRQGKGEEISKEGKDEPNVRSRNECDRTCLNIHETEGLQEEIGNSFG